MDVLRFPLAKATIFFCIGLVCCRIWRLHFEVSLAGCLAAAAITLFVFRTAKTKRNILSALLLVLFFSIGALTESAHREIDYTNNYFHKISKTGKETVLVTLQIRLKPSKKYSRYIAKIESVANLPAKGSVLTYLPTNRSYYIGQRLAISGWIRKNTLPPNPGQFDYGQYLENKSIYAQLFAINAVATGCRKNCYYYADQWRNRSISNLRNAGFDPEALAMVNALILGQQQDLSPDILHDYQYAGAVHILSVSGLHVGFLLLFVNFMLGRLPRTRRCNLIRFLLIIIVLWSFAAIAGLSPSVVRSVTMFSFVALGTTIRRSTNVFHTLLVSMLLILLFRPSFLFDVGFQLSYCALFFILWLQPLLALAWEPKNKISRYLRDLISVSLAAQLGTLPLSLYYFHQFPGLFLVTNLVVIPFLGIIMILGIVVIVLAAFGIVFQLTTVSLQFCINVQNFAIRWIAQQRQFTFHEIPFNIGLLVASYILIIAAVGLYKRRSARSLLITLAAIVCLQTTYLTIIARTDAEKEWTVFHIKGQSLIAVRTGRAIAFTGSVDESTETALNGYALSKFAKLESVGKQSQFLTFGRSRIFVADSGRTYLPKHKAEILLLTQSTKLNIDRAILQLHPEMVIADGSNKTSFIQRWSRTCSQQKIPFHATGEKGYFIISD